MEEENKYKKILDRYLKDLIKEDNFTKKYERILILKNFLEWLKNGKYIGLSFYRDFDSKIKEFSDSVFNSKTFSRDFDEEKKNPFQNTKFLFFLSSVFVLSLITIVAFNIFLLKKVNDIDLEPESGQANRVLPFKGTITEADGQPLQSKRDITFRLYNEPKGGEILYTGSCVGQYGIMPDHQGSFNIRIGSDCQMKPLSQSLFSSNQTLYLGVAIGSAEELKPRYQIFTSTYARDAAQLQGMSIGTKTSSIPYIDNTGKLVIDAEAPTLVSTDGTFTIEGKRILMKGSDTVSGDIIFQPAISGNVLISSGRLGIGTLRPNNLLSVVGNSPASPVATIKNITNINSNNTSVLSLHLGSATESESSNFIDFYAGSTELSEGEKVGGVRLNNAGVAYETSGADFAEYVKVFDQNNISEGTIISISYKGPHASLLNEKILGAVTSTAGFVGNQKIKEESAVLVGLVGQIEVLVSTINGEIDTGSRVGATMIPGFGGRVSKNDFSVGYALESTGEKELSTSFCPLKFRTSNDPNGQIVKCGKLLIFIDQD